MSSDAEDLIAEIEKSFDISIPAQVAGGLTTPGDVFRYLEEAGFAAMAQGPWLSPAVFRRLRRATVEEFQVKRIDISPNAKITQLIPQFRIRSRRMSLFRRLALKRAPPIIADRVWFKRDFGSFDELAMEILARNYGQLAEEAGFWNPSEAWDCLKILIVYQTGVKAERITRKVDFVNDLGID